MERKSILEGMFHHVNGEDEPPVSLSLPTGTGPFVFVCEHASNRIPAKFNSLGVSDAVRMSHAAWDIGALALSQSLSNHFQSPLVASTVSRLVYDCNRAPESPTAIVKSSEHDAVPGNPGPRQYACYHSQFYANFPWSTACGRNWHIARF